MMFELIDKGLIMGVLNITGGGLEDNIKELFLIILC